MIIISVLLTAVAAAAFWLVFKAITDALHRRSTRRQQGPKPAPPAKNYKHLYK